MSSNLEYIQIENLRSLQMNASVEMLPITILVGKNSAGKSTFARSFPLLRQSTEAKKRGPILWFGDRVDFGSFEEAVSRSEKEPKEITISLGLTIHEDNQIGVNRGRKRLRRLIKTHTEITIQKQGTSSHSSTVKINAFGYNISLEINANNVMSRFNVDDVSWHADPKKLAIAQYGAILPNFRFFKYIAEHEFSIYTPFIAEIEKLLVGKRIEPIRVMLENIIKSSPLLPIGTLSDYVLKDHGFIFKEMNPGVIKFIKNRLIKIEPFLFASKINSLIDFLNSGIKDYYSGVKYIEPLRATALRYYRKQELAIDEIDSKGENLAMFIDNLSPSLLRNFNNWTKERFGFVAKTKNDGGHVAIVINENNSKAQSNLADIGFGVSQILPVITQIWYSTVKETQTDKKTTNCIVIEQPELHLHPSFQAKLADVFATAIIDTKTNPPKFIIETHSNHIINRLGQLISKGELKSSSVQILIFDKNEDSVTEISQANFDEEGYLTNWPIGFFEPEA
ncbi:AAA family ATPase [Undibacterium sp. Ji42W]|uniref:AAA family ATPase n=1 Tax=Undibacterium sp. Ji42W TaxID=3413039 RepID=UPI003BF0C1C9